MQIVINKVKQTNNDQNIWCTLTDDDGNGYRCVADAPLGVDVQDYLDGKIDDLYDLTQTGLPWVDRWNPKKVQAEADMPQSVLHSKTNQQIETYLDNNVTDLASAKTVLKLLAIEVRNIIRRQEWE